MWCRHNQEKLRNKTASSDVCKARRLAVKRFATEPKSFNGTCPCNASRQRTTTQRLRLRTSDLKLTQNCQIRFRTCDSRRLAEKSSQHDRHVLVACAHAFRRANAQQRNAPLPQHVNVGSNAHSWRCEIYVVRTASLPARARRQHWIPGARGATRT